MYKFDINIIPTISRAILLILILLILILGPIYRYPIWISVPHYKKNYAEDSGCDDLRILTYRRLTNYYGFVLLFYSVKYHVCTRCLCHFPGTMISANLPKYSKLVYKPVENTLKVRLHATICRLRFALLAYAIEWARVNKSHFKLRLQLIDDEL